MNRTEKLKEISSLHTDDTHASCVDNHVALFMEWDRMRCGSCHELSQSGVRILAPSVVFQFGSLYHSTQIKM